MQNRQVQRNRKWLGIGFLAIAIMMMLILLAGIPSGFYGHMSNGMHGYGHPGYGPHEYAGHMMGYGSMSHGWLGGPPIHGSGIMMRGLPMMPWSEFTSELVLTAEQQQRIAAIREQSDDNRSELLDRLDGEQRKLVGLLDADDPDPALTGTQFARAADLRRQLLELGLDERRRIDAVLTREQRNKVRKQRRAWTISGDAF